MQSLTKFRRNTRRRYPRHQRPSLDISIFSPRPRSTVDACMASSVPVQSRCALPLLSFVFRTLFFTMLFLPLLQRRLGRTARPNPTRTSPPYQLPRLPRDPNVPVKLLRTPLPPPPRL